MLLFAMPLLQLLARLRTTAVQADPAVLRERTDAELHAFEARALKAGLPADQVRRGQYALCESLDDAVLNTPWGAHSAWARHTAVAAFHPAIGPGRFFDALRQAEAKAATMRPVLELMVLCLSLGMMGTYRDRPDGAAAAEALRTAAVAALLAVSPPAPDTLAADWKGVDAPYRRRRARLPVWVAGVAALAAAGGVFLLVSLRVNAAGDALFARMLAAPPLQMPAIARAPAPPLPPPPVPSEPTAQDRLRSRLASGHAAGIVVAGTPSVPVLRLPERVLFLPGSATPGPQAAPLLQAVAEALRPEGGRLRVVGYTDDRPVRTVLFPSAFKLSAAQAQAVRAALAHTLGPALPIATEGRAAADPVAPNTTAENREQNRRVEVVLDGAPP